LKLPENKCLLDLKLHQWLLNRILIFNLVQISFPKQILLTYHFFYILKKYIYNTKNELNAPLNYSISSFPPFISPLPLTFYYKLKPKFLNFMPTLLNSKIKLFKFFHFLGLNLLLYFNHFLYHRLFSIIHD
jgi:hypothetical protein